MNVGDRQDAHRVLEVDPDACREVIDAAFSALREKLIREDPPDASRRLARLNAAHRALSRPPRSEDGDVRQAGSTAGTMNDPHKVGRISSL